MWEVVISGPLPPKGMQGLSTRRTERSFAFFIKWPNHTSKLCNWLAGKGKPLVYVLYYVLMIPTATRSGSLSSDGLKRCP